MSAYDELVDTIAAERAHWSAEADRHRTALQSCSLALESDFQQWLKEANARVEMLDRAAAAIRALEGERETRDGVMADQSRRLDAWQAQAAEDQAARQSAEAQLAAVRGVIERVSRITVDGEDHTRFADRYPLFAKVIEDSRQALASLDKEKAG